MEILDVGFDVLGLRLQAGLVSFKVFDGASHACKNRFLSECERGGDRVSDNRKRTRALALL
ncbi:hypothetical protein [Microcoleus sp. bin38.metabat.b11b12b14.051]|uniref:hypothetical protein n=1 Tax=Microcoleus sp. bin38.metabat.b11b12b14.051 TaxID=2742709 RepID=UPI0025F3D31D|nr:hypothetical protein [Microcoleus sp. bin38.metabat.b11b12b14.051]